MLDGIILNEVRIEKIVILLPPKYSSKLNTFHANDT